MTSKFTGPLIDSAQQFFTESLRCFEKNKLNMSIVHAYTAVELLMKARMCVIHDALRLDSLNESKRGQTIKWRELVFRLETVDIKLSQDEKDLMGVISTWRNDILHCVPVYDTATAKARLPQIFEFISNFSKREFGERNRLLNIVERRQIQAARRKAVTEQKGARKAAMAEGKLIGLACPKCGLRGTVCERQSKHYDAYCHYCKSDLRWGPCDYCERMLLTDDIYNADLFHIKCAVKESEGFEPDVQPFWK
jgi:hypothetical protein